MSWQAASMLILVAVLVAGFVWFERSRPSARVVAAVAAMAALAVAGRLALAPVPNVVATTDVALVAGYSLGAGPGFAVGALAGLVSNFWLGQGPWTPWQMAGWGMVGIGGAALARVRGRRLGRLELAAVAALAGLAYGALLDLSVMVSFGGEQSLDRYFALAARGLPFNIAHAAGNFVLMLAAGPALLRMLDRYRGRFEHRWSDVPLGRAGAALLLAACLLVPLVSADHAAASGRGEAREWLLAAQNDDGGFGAERDADSSTDMTGWAILGLESAGVNPRDLRSRGVTPIEYLRDNEAAISSVGDLELVILGLEGAGLDSRSFEGRDLVAELRERQAGDGSFQHQVNLTAFSILAQRAAGESGSSLGRAASWLRSKQNRNGGWGSLAGADSEPDSSGAVIGALAVAPGSNGGPIGDAVSWLKRNQRKDGGWSLTAGAVSNTQSTAWAIQGLVAAGVSPGTVRSDGSSGLDFIFSRQASDGRFVYSGSSDQTPVWVTAQGLTGVMRQPFPIPPVPREKPDPPSGEDDPVDSSGGTYTAPTYTPPSSGSYDLGGGSTFDFGGSGSGSGSGSGPLPGSDGGGQGSPGTLPLPGSGSTGDGSTVPDAGPLDTFAPSAATPLPMLPSQDSPLPGTLVFVAGIGLLAAGLGAGFIRYRRRQL